MFRKTVFWLHLSAGVTAGAFILMMAATGVLLAFERQIVQFVDRDIEYVSVPQDLQSGSLNDLLQTVRRADLGDRLRRSYAITLRRPYSFRLAGAKASTLIPTAAPFSSEFAQSRVGDVLEADIARSIVPRMNVLSSSA